MNNGKVLLLWAVVVWFYGPVWGQEGKVDSLEQLLLIRQPDTTRILILQELCTALMYQDANQAKLYIDSALFLSKEKQKFGYELSSLNLKAVLFWNMQQLDSALYSYKVLVEKCKEYQRTKQIASAYSGVGGAFHQLGQLDSAEYYQNQAIKAAGDEQDTTGYVRALINLGYTLTAKGENVESINVLLKAAREAAGMGNKIFQGVAYYNAGNIFAEIHEHERAMEYFSRAQALFIEAGDEFRTMVIKNNMANSLIELGQLNLADSLVLELFEVENMDPLSRAYGHYLKGRIAFEQENYTAALEAYKQGYQLEESIGSLKELAISALAIGSTYLEMGGLTDAERYLSKALLLAEENGMVPESLKAKKKLLELFLKQYGHVDQLLLFQEANTLQDSLFEWSKVQTLNLAETQYQTEQKELQNQALQRETELQAQINRNQRLGLGGLSLGLLALAGLSIFLYRQRQRIQAQKSEIELLHREQRHRMMNNLVFANSLMSLQVNRLKEQPEAQQAVKEADARLRAMSVLQSRLHHDGEGQKTVAIREYLEEITTALQRSFGSPEQPLRIHLQAPDAERVDGEAAMRIGLIVNELATNSCKHAFAEQPNPEINVALQPETEGHYRLIYTDNGSGLPADFQVDTKQSMGLFLIHNLVKQLNGRIAFSGEKGTRVECELDLKAA
ncbi:tetratricopeptide repeat-containing sensor histidine kinase [Phaeodactylibacter xiamenensis]|uniref:tetratricopeptide repeat-containing sensor histidine kinase n=1 Tax=Phaeodactylibacter xiamenensis TaxID=1524460 RepID=UPI0024A96739|nr:histidine kinase dimerization/phosphoacceptor domain -containing protein [Phaeodactylibacter xiamenensis]